MVLNVQIVFYLFIFFCRLTIKLHVQEVHVQQAPRTAARSALSLSLCRARLSSALALSAAVTLKWTAMVPGFSARSRLGRTMVWTQYVMIFIGIARIPLQRHASVNLCWSINRLPLWISWTRKQWQPDRLRKAHVLDHDSWSLNRSRDILQSVIRSIRTEYGRTIRYVDNAPY